MWYVEDRVFVIWRLHLEEHPCVGSAEEGIVGDHAEKLLIRTRSARRVIKKRITGEGKNIVESFDSNDGVESIDIVDGRNEASPEVCSLVYLFT